MRNGSHWSSIVFEKGLFLTQIVKDFRPEALYYASESTQILQQGCFSFIIRWPILMTNWDQIFIGLLFYAYVGIHQVGLLVFDNYQRCVPSAFRPELSTVFGTYVKPSQVSSLAPLLQQWASEWVIHWLLFRTAAFRSHLSDSSIYWSLLCSDQFNCFECLLLKLPTLDCIFMIVLYIVCIFVWLFLMHVFMTVKTLFMFTWWINKSYLII